jgi:hypothetical protein
MVAIRLTSHKGITPMVMRHIRGSHTWWCVTYWDHTHGGDQVTSHTGITHMVAIRLMSHTGITHRLHNCICFSYVTHSAYRDLGRIQTKHWQVCSENSITSREKGNSTFATKSQTIALILRASVIHVTYWYVLIYRDASGIRPADTNARVFKVSRTH